MEGIIGLIEKSIFLRELRLLNKQSHSIILLTEQFIRKLKRLLQEVRKEHFIMKTTVSTEKHDFTLIELLVVIAIIAIMIASKAGFFLQFSAIFVFKAL